MKKLKKNLTAVSIASFIILFSACGGNDKEDETYGTSTETTAEFDNSNFGLYKGVIVGSSGVIKININNGNGETKASITIDGRIDNLTCSTPLTSGQNIEEALFSGNFSSFSFSVNANGSNPIINNINIDGHDDVGITVLKEKSTDIVTCYEGTSTGGNNHNGVFNVVRNNNSYSTIATGPPTWSFSGSIGAEGSVSASTSSYFSNDDVNFIVQFTCSGSFNGDNLSGTWNTSWDGGTNYGTFTGKKTL